jgi:hypothetical protein
MRELGQHAGAAYGGTDLLLERAACWAATALLQLQALGSHRRQLLFAWRVAAAWLLVVSVIVGPMGLGVAIASAKTCGVSCPCDEGHASEDGDHAHDSDVRNEQGSDDQDVGHGDEDCPDDCPEDCPDCGCCFGVVLAVVPLTMPSMQAPYEALMAPTPPQAQALGAPFDVYRPPRSLT